MTVTITDNMIDVPLVDLHAQYEALREDILRAIEDVLKNMRLFLGPQLQAFEQEFASFCGCGDAVGVGNGTDALELALRALGVGSGDEVITQPNSFIATAEAISAVGAVPVLADVDARTATLDPARFEAAITPRTRAVIPVHLYGRPADMAAILAIARARGLAVVEDACQAHGAWTGGKRVGAVGDLACFSFYYSKNLGAYGEGGAVTTNDPALAAGVRVYRDHGSRVRYRHEVIGHNSRLDELQAAILRVKLRHLDSWNERRRRHAWTLNQALTGASLTLPPLGGDGTYDVFHLYVVRHPQRDALRAFLAARGIGTGIHYPIPIHLQPAYAWLGCGPGSFPVAEHWAAECLSLPMYAELTEQQIERVVEAVWEFERAGA